MIILINFEVEAHVIRKALAEVMTRLPVGCFMTTAVVLQGVQDMKDVKTRPVFAAALKIVVTRVRNI